MTPRLTPAEAAQLELAGNPGPQTMTAARAVAIQSLLWSGIDGQRQEDAA